MVAIVAGNGLGLFNTSANVLGGAGVLGQGWLGQAGGRSYVNAATGNLVLQFQDEQLSGRGADLFHLRTYNSLGQLTDGDADGWRWDGERKLVLSGTVNTSGSTVTRTDGDGSETVFTWNGSRYVSKDGAGAHDTLEYDASLPADLRWKYTEGSTQLVERYGTTSAATTWRLTHQTDTTGNTIDYGYTSDRLTSVTDHGSGQFIELVYSGNPAKLSQVNTHALVNGVVGSAVKQVEYTYDAGRLKTVKTVLNPGDATAQYFTTTYSYEGSSTRVTSIVQGDGTRVDFTYDGSHRIASVTDASGVQTFNYVSATQTDITIETGDGSPKLWSYIYDSSKRLTQIKSPAPSAGGTPLVTTFHYDADSNVDEITDARGFKITYKYDDRGNRIRERDEEGNTVSRTYNAQNQLLTLTHYKSTDPNGADDVLPSDPLTTRFIYDAQSRLRFTISAEGRVTENRYGTGTADAGLLVRTIQYAGGRYDAATATESLLTTWVGTQNKQQVQQVQFEYDFHGDLAKRTEFANVGTDGTGILDAAAIVTEYVSDAHGRLLNTIAVRGVGRDQRTTVTAIGYDGLGREVSRSDSNGSTTTAYDGTARTIAVTTQVSADTTRIETRSFDARGRLIGVTQAAAGIVRQAKYIYDAAGRLRLAVDAHGARRFSFYDAANRLQFSVDATGAVTAFEYNATGQLIKQTRYANAAANIGTWVDDANNPTQVLKQTLTIGTGSVDVQTNTTLDRVTQFDYDKAGRLITQTDAANTVTTTHYDGASRVTDRQTGERITRFFYDRDGRQVGVLDPLGYLTENKYDAAGRLVETVRYRTRSPGVGDASAPVWVSSANVNFTQSVSADRSLSYRAAAIDPDGEALNPDNDALTFSVVGNKPSWLTIDTSGKGGVLLTGKPPASASSYDVTLSATDEGGRSTNITLHISVSLDNHAPFWEVIPPTQKAVAGEAFSFTVPPATDPDGQALTYRVVSKTSWLAFNASTRALTGTPPAGTTGAASAVIEARDPNGLISTLTVNVNVTVNSPPTWVALPPTRFTIGFPTFVTLPAALDPEGEALTYSVVGSLPTGVTFDPATRIVGTFFFPEPVWGDYTIVFRATDPHGAIVESSMSVQVRNITDPFSLAAVAAPKAAFAALPPTDDVLSSWRPATTEQDRHSYLYYDAQGRLIGSVDEDGFLTEKVYDSQLNRVQTIRYANDLTVAADDSLDTLRSDAGDSQTSTIEFDSMGRVLTSTDVRGIVTRNEYDQVGRLVREVRGSNTDDVRATRTRYNGFNEVTGVVGGVGDATLGANATQADIDAAITQFGTHYEYDSLGYRNKAIDASGNVTLLYYDLEGRLTHTINAKGEVSETVYNLFGQVRSTRTYSKRIASSTLGQNPPPDWLRGGLVTQALRDEVAKLAVLNTDRGTIYDYDQRGLVSVLTDGFDNKSLTTTRTYNAFGELATQIRTILKVGTNATTTTNRFDYDLRGELVSTTADTGAANLNTQTVYDAFGRVVRSLDGAGTLTTTSYTRSNEDNGRAIEVSIKVTDPLAGNTLVTRTARTVYDSFGRLVKQVDARGEVTAFTYDVAARTFTVTSPEGISVTTTQSVHGETATVRDGRNNTTSYEYDKDGHLTKVTDALDHVVTDNHYDDAGRLTQTTDARGTVTTFKYDAVNRMFERRTDPSGLNLVTTLQFTAFGDQLTVTEGVGNNSGANVTRVTSYKYDRLGRVTMVVVDPAGLKLATSFEYDGLGNTTRVARGDVDHPDQQVTVYEFDTLGRRTKEIAAPSSVFGAGKPGERDLTTQYRYDAAGRLSRKIDAKGQSTWFVYDQAGELTHTINGEGEVSRNFYDANGRVVRTQRYANRLSASTLLSFGDVADVTKATPAVNANDQRSIFVYDQDGRPRFVLQNTLSSSWTIAETRYDANGNIVESRRYDKALTEARIVAISTDDDTTSAEDRGTISAHEVSTELTGTLGYTEADNKLVLVQRTRMAYDVLNRVRFTVDGLGSVSENVYDAAGNVVSRVRYAARPTLTAFTESAINDAVNRTNADNQVVYFSHDAAGRLRYSLRVVASDDKGKATQQLVDEQVYDAVGRVLQKISYAKALDGVADYKVGTLADAIKAKVSDDDRRTAYAFDAAGRLVYTAAVVRKVAGNTFHIVTQQTYNALGQVVQTTAYAKQWVLANYTKATFDTAVADESNKSASDRTTAYAYDEVGRQRFMVAADGSLQETVYDALGQAVERRRFAITVSATTPRTVADLSAFRGTLAVGDGQTRGEKYTYDKAGRVLTTTDAANAVETYTYDALGNRKTRVDRMGSTWTYTYDKVGRLRTEVSPQVLIKLRGESAPTMRSLTTLIEYDALGNLIRRTEASGATAGGINDARVTNYGYDRLGRQTSITLPGFYNATTGQVDSDSSKGFARTIEMGYDELGNLISNKIRTGTNSYLFEYKTYNRLGQLVHDIDVLNHVTGFTYTNFGEQESITRYSVDVGAATGGRWSVSGIAARVAGDSAARTITTKYDRLGRKIEVRQPAVTSYYSPPFAVGKNPASVPAPNPPPVPVTTFDYDNFGDLRRESAQIDNAGGAPRFRDTWHYYDAMGREIRTVDALGFHTARSYDALGNLTGITEYAAGNSSGTFTDLPPPLPPTTEDVDRITVFVYNALNQRTAVQRMGFSYYVFSNGSYVAVHNNASTPTTVASMTYDGVGRLKTQTDALGNLTTTDYNALGQIIKVTEPARETARANAADPFLNKVIAAPVTTFTLDAFGNIVKQERAPGVKDGVSSAGATLVVTQTYDLVGNQISSTDARNAVRTRKYDYAGRVISESQVIHTTLGSWQTVDHTIERRYLYDAKGARTATLDVFQQTAGDGTVSTMQSGQRSVYNAFGEITEERKVWGAASAALTSLSSALVASYAYDATGQVLTRTTLDGVTQYFHDFTGAVTRSEQRSRTSGDGSAVRISETFYDLLGHAIVQRLPSFDALPAGSSLTATAVAITPIVEQTYDRWGNVLSRSQGRFVINATGVVSDVERRLTTFKYNSDNQVTEEHLPLAQARSADGTSYTASIEHDLNYDILGRVVQEVDAADDIATSADESSIAQRRRKKEYNAVGQVIAEIDGTSIRTEYAYDAHGNRIGTKNADGIVFVDAFDNNGNVISHSVLRNADGKTAYRSGIDSNPVALSLNLYQYDEANRRVGSADVIIPSVIYWSYARYDERNLLRANRAAHFESVNDIGIVTTFDYDELGNRTRKVDANGTVESWSYKHGDYAVGQLDTNTNGSSVTQYEYNGFGQVSRETYAGTNNDRVYTYHDNGLLKRTLDHLSFGTIGTSGGADYWHSDDTMQYEYTANGQRARERFDRDGEQEVLDPETHELVTEGFELTRFSQLSYDGLGRVIKVEAPQSLNPGRNSIAALVYDYDELSNRRRTSSTYRLADAANDVTQERWFSYDREGRVLVADGTLQNGQIVAGTGGTTLTYDSLGRRHTAESFEGSDSFSSPDQPGVRYEWNGFRKETYGYDDLNHLSRIDQQLNRRNRVRVQNGTRTDQFDLQGEIFLYETRVSDVRGSVTNRDQYTKVAAVDDVDSATSLASTSFSTYRADGQMIFQSTDDANHDELSSQILNFYDAAGNLDHYTYRQGGNTSEEFTNTYTYAYTSKFGGYKETRITVSSTKPDTQGGTTENRYDSRGHLLQQTISNPSQFRRRDFSYDSEGNVVAKSEVARIGDQDAVYGQQDYFYANGHEVGVIGSGTLAMAQFSNDYIPISAAYPASTPAAYTVSAGDTLAGIAQKAFGDPQLWYLIADANNVSFGPNEALPVTEVGRSYRIPNLAANVHNNADTFRPFDAKRVIGDSKPSPGMPLPPAAQCDAAGRIITSVVIVVAAFAVMALTQGAATGALAGVLGDTLAGAVGAGVGAAAGSAVSQGLAVATGLKDEKDFSGRSILAAGLTAGVTKGFDLGTVGSALAGEGANLLTGRDPNVGMLSNVFTAIALNGLDVGFASRQTGMGLFSQMTTGDFAWGGAAQSLISGAIDPSTGWLFNDRARDWATIAGQALNAFATVAIGSATRDWARYKPPQPEGLQLSHFDDADKLRPAIRSALAGRGGQGDVTEWRSEFQGSASGQLSVAPEYFQFASPTTLQEMIGNGLRQQSWRDSLIAGLGASQGVAHGGDGQLGLQLDDGQTMWVDPNDAIVVRNPDAVAAEALLGPASSRSSRPAPQVAAELREQRMVLEAARAALTAEVNDGNARLRWPKSQQDMQQEIDDRMQAATPDLLRRLSAYRDARQTIARAVRGELPATAPKADEPILWVEPNPSVAPKVPGELDITVNNHAYSFNDVTTAHQMGQVIDRLVGAGYTRINVSVHAHGNPTGWVSPDPALAVGDDMIIRNRRLSLYGQVGIEPFSLMDPQRAAAFYEGHSLAGSPAADPFTASLHSPCFGTFCTPQDSEAYWFPDDGIVWRQRNDIEDHVGTGEVWRDPADYSSVASEFAEEPTVNIRRPKSAASPVSTRVPPSMLAAGGLDAGLGALGIYGGMQEDNRALAALGISSGAAQLGGGLATAYGTAVNSSALISGGRAVSTVGGVLAAPLVGIDAYNDVTSDDPFRWAAAPLKIGGLVFWQAGVAGLAVQHIVGPSVRMSQEFLNVGLPHAGRDIAHLYGG